MREQMKIAVVIPCYNVERHIAGVVDSLPSEVDTVIAIDDRSTDNTGLVLEQLAAKNVRLTCIRHDTNQGVGGAMITGYRKALELGAEIVIKIDGDGQMDPRDIPALIQPLLQGTADFTKGNRFRDLSALRRMPVIRRIGNLGLSFLIKAASGYWNIFDPSNGFTAIRHEILRDVPLDKIDLRYFFESSMLIQLYHLNAVVRDVPMKARYGDEVSGLSITRTLFEFPPKLLIAFIKRIILRYFLFDFNIASVYILAGLPLFLLGGIYGLVKYVQYASSHVPAPTGTVVIPVLLIMLGFQLLLSAVQYDMTNFPRK